MKHFSRRLATLACLFALGGPAAIAIAEPVTHESTSTDSTATTLSPCIDAAIKAGTRAWVCTPTGLTVVTDSAGKTPGEPFAAIAPAIPARTDRPAGIFDDYDTWCENGSICHRTVSNYIGETKGNAAYGNSNGVIGTFDIVLRTSLNGRQAQWKVSMIRDTGPSLQFSSVQVNCWEEVNLLPDNSCGVHGAGAPFVSGRWNSSTLFGNRLANSNEYYGAVNGGFTPTGYPAYPIGTLEGAYFNCYGNDNCYYP